MDPPDLSALYTLQHDLFLSFSFTDMAAARALHAALSTQAGVYFAPLNLPPETQQQARFQFADVLAEALSRSAHFVGLLSPAYLASAWCQLEMQGFANLHRRDGARTLWLIEGQACRDAVPATLRGQVVDGGLPALADALHRTLARGERPRGHDLGHPMPRALPGLPLRALYPPPRRAPWGLGSPSRGTPGAPPYGVYESLVREYMVQTKRRGRWGIDAIDDPPIQLEVPIDGLDPRLNRLSRYARGDAEYLLTNHVDPFHTERCYSDRCVHLMMQAGASGETPELLRWLAECRSHMGGASCREAIGLAQRAVAAGDDPAACANHLARAHYLLGEHEAAAGVLRDTEARSPGSGDPRIAAAVLARLGDAAGAAAAAARVLKAHPGFNLADERLHTRLEQDADIEQWVAGLALAGLPARAALHPDDPR